MQERAPLEQLGSTDSLPTCGELLARLTALERGDQAGEARQLRARLRAVVRSGTLDDVYTEMVGVALALDRLAGLP